MQPPLRPRRRTFEDSVIREGLCVTRRITAGCALHRCLSRGVLHDDVFGRGSCSPWGPRAPLGRSLSLGAGDAAGRLPLHSLALSLHPTRARPPAQRLGPASPRTPTTAPSRGGEGRGGKARLSVSSGVEASSLDAAGSNMVQSTVPTPTHPLTLPPSHTTRGDDNEGDDDDDEDDGGGGTPDDMHPADDGRSPQRGDMGGAKPRPHARPRGQGTTGDDVREGGRGRGTRGQPGREGPGGQGRQTGQHGAPDAGGRRARRHACAINLARGANGK